MLRHVRPPGSGNRAYRRFFARLFAVDRGAAPAQRLEKDSYLRPEEPGGRPCGRCAQGLACSLPAR